MLIFFKGRRYLLDLDTDNLSKKFCHFRLSGGLIAMQ